jgi:hypothetical protein
MIRYAGCRTKGGPVVTVNGEPLDPRNDLHNHSPDGFEWGYPGSGPAQLALAILADHLGDDDQAINLHQRFKWAVVAKLPERKWTITSRDVDVALHRIREREGST